METTPCLLCGATEAEPLFHLKDFLLGLPGSFHLVRCAECGLVYQNPRPTEAAIDAYYPPEYDPYVASPWEVPNPLTRAILVHGLAKRWKLVAKWAPNRSGQRRILDVGCATGVFLAAGSAEWAKVGVELSPKAAAFAREHFGLTVYEGMLEETPLEAESFDVITMWDVLEHLHDPRRTLARVRHLLRPDGIFIFRVPNFDAWDARLAGRYWAGLDQPRHLFVPDEAAIARLLTITGFRAAERLCMSGTYGVLVLSWRFWLREHVGAAGRRRAAERALNNPATRFALAPLLWAIDKVARKGSLLTVVARAVAR
ncbi:MAG: class I SAM-dependent methyltransferase [Ardenticatenaceae bacterium]|nr:class I SAM-dependent methyltransferase [Ardenticatenaceae bacterium]